MLEAKKIWLNPEYQRNAVWTRSQQQLLIDSLLNGFDVPKLYFREISKESFEYEVVDGQQRLIALREFISKNTFTLSADADPVDGAEIKGKTFSKLPTSLQTKLQAQNLDVVLLGEGYSDEVVEDMFLRLQNGTPLNAAEKRRALPGNMPDVVSELATHSLFELCNFDNRRFAYEDVVAKTLHLLLHGSLTDIRPSSIKRTYKAYEGITAGHPTVKKLDGAMRFLVRAFKGQPSPQFKKYSVISLSYLLVEMLDKYDLANYGADFAKTFLDFERTRIENEELEEAEQDPKMAAYTDSARADSIQDLEYRHTVLRETFLLRIPELALKDPTRGFTEEQRLAVFLRDKGRCQICGRECEQADFHVDHKKPHSRSGKTALSNAQLACAKCNTSKGAEI